jgi:hypothetical protein
MRALLTVSGLSRKLDLPKETTRRKPPVAEEGCTGVEKADRTLEVKILPSEGCMGLERAMDADMEEIRRDRHGSPGRSPERWWRWRTPSSFFTVVTTLLELFGLQEEEEDRISLH